MTIKESPWLHLWTHGADGWGIFDNSDYGLRIERHDELQRFDSDWAAIAYVGLCASRGRAFDALAWEYAVSDAVQEASELTAETDPSASG